MAAGWLLSSCAMDDGAVAIPATAGVDVTLTQIDAFGAGGSPTISQREQGIQLGYATAVAAAAGEIYVIDSAASALVRLDAGLGEIRVLHQLRDANTAGLHVSQDLIVKFVDRYGRAVVEIDQSGWERRRFEDSRRIPAPVDVSQTNWGSTVLIADGLSQSLAVFDSMGNPAGMLTPGLSPVAVAASITAIAATNDYVYVLDATAREVTQLDLGGRPVATYGEDALLSPTAMAVDECLRVFVADGHAEGLFVSSPEYVGANARAALPPEVGGAVTDLWIDSNTLYIAAGNLGVYVMTIDPPCMGP